LSRSRPAGALFHWVIGNKSDEKSGLEMRPDSHAALAATPSAATLSTAVSYPAEQAADHATAALAAAPGRDLIDLLAVIVGICESLADSLAASPQHGELARVGALAANRAADLVTELRVAPAAASDEDGDPPPPPAPGARKVLVVEDDRDLLSLLTAAFERAGFQAFAAGNGRLGVKMLAELQPDLMVTDIVMPEMEGIGAIIEAKRQSPHTRVIAISGGGKYGRSGNFLEWAAELGADEVLAKPFRVSSLITAARLVLDRPPPLDALAPRRPLGPPRLVAVR
jgi:CheY-like chemotaxis protein